MPSKDNRIRIEILKKGDTVLNVWENHIAVQKKSGEVEVFVIEFDENGQPRIAPKTFLVTYDNEIISPAAKDVDAAITTNGQSYRPGITSPPVPISLVDSPNTRPSSNPDQQNQNGETLEDLVGSAAKWGYKTLKGVIAKKRAAANREDKEAANQSNTPDDHYEENTDGE